MPPSPERAALGPPPDGPRVAVVGDKPDWHARALMRRLAERGAVATFVRLAECAFSTVHPRGVLMPGFAAALPDAVLVRAVAAGSFEAVTRRLGILHALRELGIPVWNDARAIERCVDKSMTSFLIAKAGIPTPDTWTVEGREAASRIAGRECPRAPLVLKPLFGSQGRGLALIRQPADLPDEAEVTGVYYLQRFVGQAGDRHSDFRAFVVGGHVAAAMERRAAHWITNVRRGGKPHPADLPPELARLAIDAAAAVGADFAGVDILIGAGGRPFVLEVNSMPAWTGLQSVTKVDIAAAIADGLLAALGRRAGHAPG